MFNVIDREVELIDFLLLDRLIHHFESVNGRKTVVCWILVALIHDGLRMKCWSPYVVLLFNVNESSTLSEHDRAEWI